MVEQRRRIRGRKQRGDGGGANGIGRCGFRALLDVRTPGLGRSVE